MTIPFWCVLAAWFLVFLPKLVVAWSMNKLKGGYDNDDPRDQHAHIDARGKRALAAHYNGFEAFAPFAAGVIIAHLAGANEGHMTICALTFVAARTVYPFLYIAGLGWARSSVWAVGVGATVALFVLGAMS